MSCHTIYLTIVQLPQVKFNYDGDFFITCAKDDGT